MKTRPIGERFLFNKKFEPKCMFETTKQNNEGCDGCDLWMGENTTCVDGYFNNGIIGECFPENTEDGIGRIFKKV